MAFNPFDKTLLDPLDSADLAALITHQVAEGYYVEYMSEFPGNAKIAHSIASLANTNGGWYFVGTTEDRGVATDIRGFSIDENPDPIAKVRDIARSRIDPIPVFYSQLVSVADNAYVLAVYVPGEQDTPFVTSDGRVYRRVADSSDPIPENDCGAFDRLVDAGKRAGERFQEFCVDERQFSKGEEDDCWVSVYLRPYPRELGTALLDPGDDDQIDQLVAHSRELSTLLELEESPITSRIGFNSIHPTSNSVVLRYVEAERAAFSSLSFELFSDGSAKLHVPVLFFADWIVSDGLDSLESDAAKEAILAIHDDSRYLLRFFDMGQLSLVVATLLALYRTWLTSKSASTEVDVAIGISGMWRAVPFFDFDEWGGRMRPPTVYRSPRETPP
ncbi:MAG TPA: ATP-binding protein [Dehalococcoidia bacterium]|nr:ATP-binding protein [Dehalococcoidia bacterium]